MDLIVTHADGHWRAVFGDAIWPCAIGRTGVTRDKREGDGATPAGCWTLRRVLYRPDRMAAPATDLPSAPLSATDGWCDDADDPRYNQPVTLPTAARHERLWREDGLYDIIVVLSHNETPAIPGHGSAIFLHVAAPGYAPTEGCVALALPDLLTVLAAADGHTRVCIAADDSEAKD
jgi:L,D-peptidoglycan transpeptidase YkuD (ErfK/YbiS/YcfS/YnhG family)